MTQFLLYGRAVAACIVLSLSLTACGGSSTNTPGAANAASGAQPSSAPPSTKLSCAP
jgi:hypothetical protein